PSLSHTTDWPRDMADERDSINRDAGVGTEKSGPMIAESAPAQESAEVRPEESPSPDKPDERAPSTSDAPERDTEKPPAVNASASKAETASTPDTETTSTASNAVDPTIAYVLAQQLSRRRRPIGRTFLPEPAVKPPGSLARRLKESPSQPSGLAPAPAEWLEDRILAWIISRRETKLTPEMRPKIEWAKQELVKAATKELNKMLARSVEIDRAVAEGRTPHALNEGVFRIGGLRSGWLAHLLRIGRLTLEDIQWENIAGDPEGVKRLWPACETNTLADRQLYAEDGSEPAVCAEESTSEPASLVESEPALPTELPRGGPARPSDAKVEA